MKVAITGASGFLGRYLSSELTASGHQCRGLIRPTSRHLNPKLPVEWVVGSLEDPIALNDLVEGADAVIHAALDHPGGGFLRTGIDVASFVDRNLIGTIRLIEAAKAAGVGRFVVISSGAVHDEILGDRPLDETHPLWPRTHYGATKAAIEAFVHSYGRGEKFPICALRPTAIYGLADPLSESRSYHLIAAVVRGEDVTCRGGSKQVHAGDVARATQVLLSAKGVAGEVFHCTDLFVADRDVAMIARTIADSNGKIQGEAPTSRNPISCEKLRNRGMKFGGQTLLEATIEAMVRATEFEFRSKSC